MAYSIVSPSGEIGKFKNDKEVVEWSYEMTRSAYNNWDEDKILSDWKEKAEFINSKLE
jgi:hypothetical protein